MQTVRAEKVTKAKALEIQYLAAGQAGNLNSSLTVQFDSQRIRDALLEYPALGGQVLPLMLYELSRLLVKYPALTAFYENGNIYYYDAVHLALAMDLGKGLKAPVIKHINELEPIQVYERVQDLASRYMSNELAPEELAGGTFTVSDLSSENILHFQPLINQRQAAILGVGGDRHLKGFPMTLTLVFDHRILAGREAGMFLNELKSRLLSYDMDNLPETNKHRMLNTVVCGRCAISLSELYRDYQRDAVMYLHMNNDGAQDYICYQCATTG
jgi:2-oxoglutarate dehydrogenase E2 component (dihydrolipoamide succinyltransferase)